MSKFNYQQASTEEITEHFATVTRQAVWLVKQYYKNDDSTLQKILQAEKASKSICQQNKLLTKLQQLLADK